MTIDEAIEKYKAITNTNSICSMPCISCYCENCVEESTQLLEWLEELSKHRAEELFRKTDEKAIRDKAFDDFADKIISLCDDREFMNRFNKFPATTSLKIAKQLKEEK